MKANLIILPSPFLLEQRRNCPLGVLYVAAAIEGAGHETRVIDLRDVAEEEWLGCIPEADLHGISASSLEFPYAVALATMLKERGDGVIALGGVHATVSEFDLSSMPKVFDIVVKGEGEVIVPEPLISDVESVGRLIYTTSLGDIDRYPFPARHLLPFDIVTSKYLVERGVPATTIIGSRGCPYKCAFCASPTIYKNRVRQRKVESIAEEINALRQQGIAQFRFHDDILTLNRKWLLEFRDRLAPMGIKFRANARVDQLDEERVELLTEAGCIDVNLGIESVYQPTLDLIEKGQTVEQAREAVLLCNRKGLKTRLSIIIGLPGDFGDLSGRTIEFLEETGPNGVDLNSLIVFPGCRMFSNPKHYGIRFRPNYSLDNLRMLTGAAEGELNQDFTIEYDQMSNEELKYHRRRVSDYIYRHQMNVDD